MILVNFGDVIEFMFGLFVLVLKFVKLNWMDLMFGDWICIMGMVIEDGLLFWEFVYVDVVGIFVMIVL